MDEFVIKADHISKIYKLFDKPADRLKESLGLSRKKKYREHFALNEVDLAIKKGETVGIIGTNGSGKSTILKIITGVISPSSGSIAVKGRISALLELGAGFNMEYTGMENVYLNGIMLGFTKEEIDQRLHAILEFADIGDFVHQPVKSYSSGMFVRLAFAVAINIDPEILIVDEALSVGDVFFQAKCYRKFEEFRQMGKTILFVSHDLGSITKYCDRVILLNKGEKMMEGSPKAAVDMFKRVLVNQTEEQKKDTKIWAPDDAGEKMKSQLNVNPQTLEYGDKRAEIVDFAIYDQTGKIGNVIEKGSEFSIKMKVLFQETIKEPIFAFTLKDIHGTEITGTNTLLEKYLVNPQQQGAQQEIMFSQRMQLQGGEYLLSLGVSSFEKQQFVVYHRLYDVCGITVVSDKNTVGYFDMESSIVIK
jgi:teichoic acid transport system ATP-binding protein